MKKLTALMLTLVLALSLTACGGTTESSSNSTTPPSSSQATTPSPSSQTNTPAPDNTANTDSAAPDVGTFEGDPNGYGVWTYDNVRYEGNWQNGIPNGEGTLYRAFNKPDDLREGERYALLSSLEGNWSDGFADGVLVWSILYDSQELVSWSFDVVKGYPPSEIEVKPTVGADAPINTLMLSDDVLFSVPSFSESPTDPTAPTPPEGGMPQPSQESPTQSQAPASPSASDTSTAPQPSQSAQSNAPAQSGDTTPAPSASNAVAPDINAFRGSTFTLSVEALSDTKLRIILHDPNLAAAYSVKEANFAYLWEIEGGNGASNVNEAKSFTLASGTGGSGGSASNPVIVDMTQARLSNAVAGMGTQRVNDFSTVFTCDPANQNLIWEVELAFGTEAEYTQFEATIIMEYGNDGERITTSLSR